MSWNLDTAKIERLPLGDALKALDQSNAPAMIKAYVREGLEGMRKIHGDDVRVTVTGYGHVCEGPGSYEVTSATIDVRRSPTE